MLSQLLYLAKVSIINDNKIMGKRVTETEIVKYLDGSDVLVLMKRFTYEIAQDMLSKRLFSI